MMERLANILLANILGEHRSLYKIFKTTKEVRWFNVGKRTRNRHAVEEIRGKDIDGETIYLCRIPSERYIRDNILPLEIRKSNPTLARKIHAVIENLAENGVCVDLRIRPPSVLSGDEKARIVVEIKPQVEEALEFFDVERGKSTYMLFPYLEPQKVLEYLEEQYEEYRERYNIDL